MDNIYRLAKLFKERENPGWTGAQIGTVQSTSPLIIKLGSKITLTSRQLYAGQGMLQLMQHRRNSTMVGSIRLNGYTNSFQTEGSITLESVLNVGDQVALFPMEDEQNYIVLDKVVRP